MLRVLSLFNLQGANPSSRPPQPLSGTSSCGTPLFYHTARALSSTFFDPSKLFPLPPLSRAPLGWRSVILANPPPIVNPLFQLFSIFSGRLLRPGHPPISPARGGGRPALALDRSPRRRAFALAKPPRLCYPKYTLLYIDLKEVSPCPSEFPTLSPPPACWRADRKSVV